MIRNYIYSQKTVLHLIYFRHIFNFRIFCLFKLRDFDNRIIKNPEMRQNFAQIFEILLKLLIIFLIHDQKESLIR
jgi:hypothetical protein